MPDYQSVCPVPRCELRRCMGKRRCALRRYFLLEQMENRRLLGSLRAGSPAWREVHARIYFWR